MSKPFKFRYVNELAGVFVLLVLALFVIGVFMVGRVQGWYETYETVIITFPAEGSSGLRTGAEVQMLGTLVGKVERITLSEAGGEMQAQLSVRSDFFRNVRQDSRAIIRKKFVITGDAFVEVTKGEGESFPEQNQYRLPCEIGRELVASIQEFVDDVRESDLIDTLRRSSLDVRDSLLEALELTRKFLSEYTDLAMELRDPDARLQQILARLDRIGAKLERGESTTGLLLTDRELGERFSRISVTAEEVLVDARSVLHKLDETTQQLVESEVIMETLGLLHSVLLDIKAASVRLPDLTSSIKGEVEDMPGLILQIKNDLRQAEELMAAIKRHWLIRGYVPEDQLPASIPPAAVEPWGDRGVREQGKRGGAKEGERE